ncbi:MAG: histidinol-phosphate transaminase, partial [Gemmatimonadota bacterium]|nr:histidinol-phosphate transaminase [Gemmatimonadota bacterium]
RLLLEQQRLLIPSPSYERFVALGQRCAAKVIPVPLHEENFALVPERFIEAGRQSGARVLLLSSPNNPTGNLLCGDAELVRLLDQLPDCLCIVDEAYADYADHSYVPWVQERENLVMLRTFSKAYGMAGLRIGYAVGPKPVIAALDQMQVPWAVNALSLVAAQAALADQDYLHQIVAQIRSDCQALYEGLSERMWLRAYPSAANFFWVRCGGIGSERLRAGLEKRRIRARWRQDAPDFVRLTSLRPQDNEYLLAALDEVGQSG